MARRSSSPMPCPFPCPELVPAALEAPGPAGAKVAELAAFMEVAAARPCTDASLWTASGAPDATASSDAFAATASLDGVSITATFAAATSTATSSCATAASDFWGASDARSGDGAGATGLGRDSCAGASGAVLGGDFIRRGARRRSARLSASLGTTGATGARTAPSADGLSWGNDGAPGRATTSKPTIDGARDTSGDFVTARGVGRGRLRQTTSARA